jgi:hypothetical protein
MKDSVGETPTDAVGTTALPKGSLLGWVPSGGYEFLLAQIAALQAHCGTLTQWVK